MHPLCRVALLGLTACSGSPTPASSTASTEASTEADSLSPSGSDRPRSKGKTRRGGPGKGTGKARDADLKHGTRPSKNRSEGRPSPAESKARMIARCSDGQVVFGFWPGEYPSPIPQLDATVVVDVHDDPCGGPVRGCAVEAGLLHPWAKPAQASSQKRFGHRTRTVSYTLLRAHSLGGTRYSAGTSVELLSPLAEGYCAMLVEDRLVEDMCPGRPADLWRAESTTELPRVQMVEVGCQGGPDGWLVVDEAFVRRKDVAEGQVRAYGEIGRAH